MTKRKRPAVLLSSAGRRVQLLRCFRESATVLRQDIGMLAADMRPQWSAACNDADISVQVPSCGDPAFIPTLIEQCASRDVALIVPTIDPELLPLSRSQHLFADAGVQLALSTSDVVETARDKMLTADVLRTAGVNTPVTVGARQFSENPHSLSWPVIMKPRGGSSSVGIILPKTLDDAIKVANSSPDLIVQELWQGREYTVSMYIDRAGNLRCAVPHWRIETRGGEVAKGQTEDIPILRLAARKIAAALPGLRGAVCFQAILTPAGEFAVFELNARFGGGYPLAHHAGAKFTQWLLEETLGLPCTAHDDWRPGVTMLRYDDAVFVEP